MSLTRSQSGVPEPAKQIAVLGSTGSIGVSALEVIAQSGGRLQASVLSAHSKFDALLAQAQRHRPRWVVATDAKAAKGFDWSDLPAGCELLAERARIVPLALGGGFMTYWPQ